MKVHFLGRHARSGEPYYAPWSEDRLRRAAARANLGRRDVRHGVSALDPAEAGWGLVYPKGIDERILDALEPLTGLRCEQAGRLYREIDYISGESTDRFRRRHQAGIGLVDPERMPYYLLLIGGPDQIPWDLQLDLGVQHAVGRLAFQNIPSYAAYAKSAAAHEASRTRPRPGLDLFSFDHDGDEATQQALLELIRPLSEGIPGCNGLEVRTVESRDATRDRLAAALADGPSVVFTMGHSILYDQDDKDLERLQGSLLTGEWQKGETIESRHIFWPSDLDEDADLSGRVVYLYGCHTAGTPAIDGFDPEPGRRKRLAPRPFVAPLAQRLLGTPAGGAVAVIGQVDRAMPSTALGWNGIHQIDTFQDTLRMIFEGLPIGRALGTFGQRFSEIAVRMMEGRFRGGEPSIDPVALWTSYQDARSVCLLGDPLASIGPATPT